MKYISIVLIKFYQRFISPYKGFRCAYHVVHGRDTCSNAINSLILRHGFFKALPFIRIRFDECRSAYGYLQTGLIPSHNVDIPCDIPCDIEIGDCSGSSAKGSACDCLSACGWPFDTHRLSKRAKRILVACLLLFMLLAFYFLYRQ